MAKTGVNPSANPDRCVGCITCMLRCSYKFAREYNPALAAVNVAGPDKHTGRFTITFSERCDGCGICAAYCLYGGIVPAAEGRSGQ